MEAQLVYVPWRQRSNPEMGTCGLGLVCEIRSQLEILARASVTITHAGLNTVMQSLIFACNHISDTS